MDRANFIKQVHLAYLNNLRELGSVNMFEARPYLLNAYPELSKDEATKVLVYWMKTFGQIKEGKDESNSNHA